MRLNRATMHGGRSVSITFFKLRLKKSKSGPGLMGRQWPKYLPNRARRTSRCGSGRLRMIPSETASQSRSVLDLMRGEGGG